jgi:LPS export ABC transporter protein LptC
MFSLKGHISFLMLCIGLLLASCENDLDQIKKITFDPKAPDEVIKNFKLIYTDSGFAQIEVYAKIAETYTKPIAITKFKDGLKVNFFSADGKIASVLTAEYGEYNTTDQTVIVRNNVILRNIEKAQQMETEQLTWNQKDSSIYSKTSVIVRSDKGIFYGDGILTKQDFSYYEFIKPHGRIDMGN